MPQLDVIRHFLGLILVKIALFAFCITHKSGDPVTLPNNSSSQNSVLDSTIPLLEKITLVNGLEKVTSLVPTSGVLAEQLPLEMNVALTAVEPDT